MKNVARLVAVAVLFLSASAFAAGLDGTYSFVSRTKDGAADLAGWTGTMKITGTTMSRNLTSKDGKETKYYESMMKNEGGNLYTCKFTKAYKPEYVGQENKNNITLKGSELTIEGTDGKFKETWTKK